MHGGHAAGTCQPGQFDPVLGSADPWGYRSRWYERRKRAIVLASLPRERFRSAYEPGCANGELTALLATRCDHLLASDFHPKAVAAARQRLAALPQVRVDERWLPDDWPAGQEFDLIVLSEIGYYLSQKAMTSLAAQARAALAIDGCLVACHWRHPIDDALCTTPAVESTLASIFHHGPLLTHREADFSLLVWTTGNRSLAAMEGLA